MERASVLRSILTAPTARPLRSDGKPPGRATAYAHIYSATNEASPTSQAWPRPCATWATWAFTPIVQEKQLVLGEGWRVIGGHAAHYRQSCG